MQITSATPQLRDPDRISIAIDGEYTLGCHALIWLESGLRVGDTITEADLAALRETETVRAVMDRALDLLAQRPRGRTELIRHLSRGTKARPAPPAELIQAAIARLETRGWIDDQAFAAYWVEQRDRFRPKGAQALRAELRERGVGRAEIEASIAPERDQDRAIVAGRTKAGQLARAGQDARSFRTHLGSFLQRRGFSYSVARTAITTLWEEVGGDAAAVDDVLESDEI